MKINSFVDITIYKADYYFALQIIVYFLIINRLVADLRLNYFVNRSTNAAAESLNSKMKGFRSELRGVRDLPFFLYRCTMIFG